MRKKPLYIKYTEENRNVSYSYTDVLTRTVEVDVFNGESYSPLFVPSDTIKKKRAIV